MREHMDDIFGQVNKMQESLLGFERNRGEHTSDLGGGFHEDDGLLGVGPGMGSGLASARSRMEHGSTRRRPVPPEPVDDDDDDDYYD